MITAEGTVALPLQGGQCLGALAGRGQEDRVLFGSVVTALDTTSRFISVAPTDFYN